MIPDLDIYRSANLLVKQHGQDAPIHAAMRADAMLEAGDPLDEGCFECARQNPFSSIQQEVVTKRGGD